MTTRKTIALTRWIFVGKVMSLLFNMLSRLVTDFLPRSKHLLISWLQSLSAVILEPKKIKSVTVSIVSLSICHKVMWPNVMIFVFWMLSCIFFFFTFNALQNFTVFCQTSTWISHRYTYIPTLLNLPPSLSPSPSFRLMQSPCLSFLNLQQIPVGYLFNIW